MFFLKCFLITILIISSNCNQIGLSKEKKTSLDPFIFIVLGADQSKSNVIDENESNQSNSGNSSGSSDEKEAEITCNIESYVFKIKSNIDIQCVVADTINVKYSITPELPLGLNFNKDTGQILGYSQNVLRKTKYTISGVKDGLSIKSKDIDLEITGKYLYTSLFNTGRENGPVFSIVDKNENVISMYEFRGNINPAKSYELNDNKSCSGYLCVAITKISKDNKYISTKVLSNSSSVYASKLLYNESNDELFIVGRYQGSIDFGAPFNASDKIIQNDYRARSFILKIKNEVYIDSKVFESSEYFSIIDAKISNQNIYLISQFSGNSNPAKDFSKTQSLASDSTDVMITRITSNFEYIDSKVIGGPGNQNLLDFDIENGSMILAVESDSSFNPGKSYNLNDNQIIKENTTNISIIYIENNHYKWTKTIQWGSLYSDNFNISLRDNIIYIFSGFYHSIDIGKFFGRSDLRTLQVGSALLRVNSSGQYLDSKIFDILPTYHQSLSITNNVIFLNGVLQGEKNIGFDFAINDIKKSTNSSGSAIQTRIEISGENHLIYKETFIFGSEKSNLCISNLVYNGYIYIYTRVNSNLNYAVEFGDNDPVDFQGQVYESGFTITKLKN